MLPFNILRGSFLMNSCGNLFNVEVAEKSY